MFFFHHEHGSHHNLQEHAKIWKQSKSFFRLQRLAGMVWLRFKSTQAITLTSVLALLRLEIDWVVWLVSNWFGRLVLALQHFTIENLLKFSNQASNN